MRGRPDDLTELRKLLLGRRGDEGERLDSVEQTLEQPRRLAEYVSRVLPEAVRLRAKRDQALTEAMQQPIEDAIASSVKRNPQPIVDAIFPVIGPAIRKAVTSAIRGMVQRLEQAIDLGLSPRALAWRFTAWRTGRPFAEVVLLKTLLYRVEQVFLIHRETGLLLQHVVADAVKAKDADLVSSMLTAIQDFVRDSFDAPEGEALESVRVGDFAVWIEPGRHAVLAAAIRGTAPHELRGVMEQALGSIEADMRPELQNYDGDPARFDLCRPHLEACLLEAKARRRSELSRLLLFFAALSLVLLGGYAYLHAGVLERRWESYLERIDAEPGLVVTRTGERGGRRFVVGLRDPLAADPATLLGDVDPDSVESAWQTYYALDPAIVLRRAHEVLQPPDGVRLSLDGDTLVVAGPAPEEWLREARARAPAIPGVARLGENR